MKLLFLFLLTTFLNKLYAQDSWVVYLNKHQVMRAEEELPSSNRVLIKAAELNNSHVFTLTYFDTQLQDDWSRFMMVNDSSDHELKRIESSKLSYPNKDLLRLLRKHGTLHIYTWALPDDPELRQRIRVRRVHLCTLVLE